MFDTSDFYYWLQRELGKELEKIYKIHRTAVLGDKFCIWFLNNDDSLSIPLNEMKEIYNKGKSMEELTSIIETKYVARIKNLENNRCY